MNSPPPRERADVASLWAAIEVARASKSLDKEWLRFMAYALQYEGRSHAQIFQDMWVLWETGARREGYFVEVGACDGVFLSNTLLLERDYGWSGVVVEPNPIFHKDLAAQRRCRIDHRCAWRETGNLMQFRAVSKPEYSVLEIVKPDDDHEQAGIRNKYDKVEVETVTLTDLLLQAAAPRVIDYISIDTEGAELEILQAFDFDAFDVRLISIEHNYTSRRRDIAELLGENGFRQRYPDATRWDDWFVAAPR